MPHIARRSILLGLLLFVVPVAASVPAQEPAETALPFWETNHGLHVHAAAVLALQNDPLAAAATRVLASENVLLTAWQFHQGDVPPLKSEWLHLVADDTPIPDLRGEARDRFHKREWAFYDLYCQALGFAHLAPLAAFERAAKENEHVTFAHLWQQPAEYRGKVVTVQGRLMRLRKWDAPKAAQTDGVHFIYEGWVEGPTRHVNPYCIIFTDLPPGLMPAEKVDRKVTFYGYFIKRFRYTAANADRKTHLLIGPTVVVDPLPPPSAPVEPYAKSMLFYALCGLLVIVALVLLITWYFSRGDRTTHSKLAEVRDKQGSPFADEGVAPDVPLATPIVPPSNGSPHHDPRKDPEH